MTKQQYFAAAIVVILAIPAVFVFTARESEKREAMINEFTDLSADSLKFIDQKYLHELNFSGLEVHYTGYQFFKPTEIVVSKNAIASHADESLALGILNAAQKQYSQEVVCHLDSPIANRCEDPRCDCAASFMKVKAWESVDLDNWRWFEDNDSIVITSQAVRSVPDINAVKQKAGEVMDDARRFEVVDNADSVIESLGEIKTEDLVFLYLGGRGQDITNSAMAENYFREVYWIMPEWTQADEVSHLYERSGMGPGDVRIHQIRVDELPDLSADQVFIAFDGDYFGNTGYDTTAEANFNYTKDELIVLLDQVFSQLARAKVRAEAVTLARSPVYAPPEDIFFLEQFFKEVL